MNIRAKTNAYWRKSVFKVSNGAKIRNRYNQVPHLTQDTNWKVTNSQLHTTYESQEVSPFPAGYHKAHINRCAQRHSKHKTEKNTNSHVFRAQLKTLKASNSDDESYHNLYDTLPVKLLIAMRLRVKFWPDCANPDTSMKFGTVVDHD